MKMIASTKKASRVTERGGRRKGDGGGRMGERRWNASLQPASPARDPGHENGLKKKRDEREERSSIIKGGR